MSGRVYRVPTGRPPFVPEPEQRILVERLIGMMIPEEVIARSFINPPISHNTFRKYFKDEIKYGRERLQGRNRALLLRAAESGNVTAMIYISARIDKDFHGQANNPDVPLPGDAGGGGYDPSGGVQFYIPENGRDWEKTIEGEAEEAA